MERWSIDLYWIPVGAGTRLQHASLLVYEWAASLVSRRPRAELYHAALKLRLDGAPWTMELMPIPAGQTEVPLMTGPVGIRAAGRLRLFRYQLLLKRGDQLPDERWALPPIPLTTDEATVTRVVELGAIVPAHVWGRRVRGTTEMWTSDSALSWLLTKAGLDASSIALPPNGRAPGWVAGIELAAKDPAFSEDAA